MNTEEQTKNPDSNEMNINLSQLKRNFQIVKSLLKSETKLMAVVNGDAYGHGMVPIAKELLHCKCDAFGVTHLTEAISLRNAGIRIPILLLTPIHPAQVPHLIDYHITPMVDHLVILGLLDQYSGSKNKTVNVHVKVNTGLNRYGIQPEEALIFLKSIKQEFPHVTVEGIYTHFPDPDKNMELTIKQIGIFDDLINQLEKENLRPSIVHVASSSVITRYPQAHYDMVRCGMLLYGLEHEKGVRILPDGIKPLVTVKALITKIRTIKAGESGGYGTDFIATRDTKVAMIAIGYGDGIGREWKEAIVSGKRVPIVNSFMDGLMVDITDIPDNVKEFDVAVVIGSQGDETIPLLEVSKHFNHFAQEQLQCIADRVPKKYYYESEK